MTAQGATARPIENGTMLDRLRRSRRRARIARWVAMAGVAVLCAAATMLLFQGVRYSAAIARNHVPSYEASFQIWASAATIAGTGFASATIALALVSYWNVQRNARLVHMHALFRELMKFEHEKADGRKEGQQSIGTSLSTTGLLLYSLEEITDAVDQEARFALLPKRKRFIADWRRTIRSHIRAISSDELARHLNAHADCYGREFLLQVVEWSGAQEVEFIVEHELLQRPRKDPNGRRQRYSPPPARLSNAADASDRETPEKAGSE